MADGQCNEFATTFIHKLIRADLATLPCAFNTSGKGPNPGYVYTNATYICRGALGGGGRHSPPLKI